MSPDLFALCAFAFAAGFVDAVVGGGGLIQIPALLLLLPGTPVAALLGTNKMASIWGTGAAAWHYLRHVELPWRSVLPTALAALVCGFLGARTASALPGDLLRPLVLCVLLLVLVYTLWRKDFGQLHAPRLGGRMEVLVGAGAGAAIGFYDGFLGPGTGSFLVLAFVGLFGFSFLHASAAAKIVNAITNLAALVWFASQGLVCYELAIPMAVCNVAGALLGSRLAVARGAAFVRAFFILVVGALTLRLGYDHWRAF